MMAEEQGFEPWHPVKSLRAFQARPFSHLGIPPAVRKIIRVLVRFFNQLCCIIVRMLEITIAKTDDGARIEKFVRRYLSDAPLSFIYKAFRKKDIKVNGHWVHKDHVLKEGDVVRIYVTDQQLEDFRKPKAPEKIELKFPIIYEDENVLIVNKPSGILVYGDAKEKRNTLANNVLNYLYFKGEYDPNSGAFVPSPAHRLDRNTSGLVIFGKNDAALKQLEELFKERTSIKKMYLALVKGIIKEEGEINAPLKKDESSGFVKVVSIENGGKTALTKYKPIEHFSSCTLVECELITGRTHQIRAHMAYIGRPLVGDGKYGDFSFNREFKTKFGIEHQFLHAKSMSFGKIDGVLSSLSDKTFVASMPKDKSGCLTKLRENN